MKKWILLLGLLLLPLLCTAQDASRDASVRKTVRVFNDNLLTGHDISVYYTSGFFTSFVILFRVNGFDNILPRPDGITGWARWIGEKEFQEVKKNTAKVRKQILKAIKDSKERGYLWLVRAETGNPQMVFRVQYENEYVDITLREEEVFGKSFEKMDPLTTIDPVYQHTLTTWKDCYPDPEGGYRLSDDKKWLLFQYNLSDADYKRDAARTKAQALGKKLYEAMQSSHVSYIYKQKPYYLASVVLGLGIQVTVNNIDTGETDTDWLTTEDILQYCLNENYAHKLPYLNRWILSVPDALDAEAREVSDAVSLEIWSPWYDLLGGQWTPERIASLMHAARKNPKSELSQVVSRCIETGKPLNVTIRSRFGLQLGGQFPAEQLKAL